MNETKVGDLSSITLKTVCEKLSTDMTEKLIAELSKEKLEQLKSLFIYKVWAVYVVRSHGDGFSRPILYSYNFAGVYSTEDKARQRVLSYKFKDKSTTTTVIAYTLDATKGRRLYRVNIPHSSVDEGLFPISNDHFGAHSPIQWMYSGTFVLRPTDEVFIDQDY